MSSLLKNRIIDDVVNFIFKIVAVEFVLINRVYTLRINILVHFQTGNYLGSIHSATTDNDFIYWKIENDFSVRYYTRLVPVVNHSLVCPVFLWPKLTCYRSRKCQYFMINYNYVHNHSGIVCFSLTEATTTATTTVCRTREINFTRS